MVAGNAAAEAMVASLAILTVERWAVFTVEGAAEPIISTVRLALLVVDAGAGPNDFRYWDAFSQIFEEAVGKPAANSLTHYPVPPPYTDRGWQISLPPQWNDEHRLPSARPC